MLLNPIILIPTGLVVVFDLISIYLFFHFYKKGNLKVVNFILAFKPISTIICVFFSISQFYLLGALYLLLSIGVTALMIPFSIFMFIRYRTELGYKTRKYALNILLCLLMVVSIAIPTLTYLPIKQVCGTSNTQRIQDLSVSIANYKSDNGHFPMDLEEMIPDYISDIPSPACSFMSGIPRSFHLDVCDIDYPNFYVRSVDLVGWYLYSFGDGEYSQIWSFLDVPDPGYCP